MRLMSLKEKPHDQVFDAAQAGPKIKSTPGRGRGMLEG
jgi:hypothetical protein